MHWIKPILTRAFSYLVMTTLMPNEITVVVTLSIIYFGCWLAKRQHLEILSQREVNFMKKFGFAIIIVKVTQLEVV